ncbi:DUF1217 domain-containing protein [uncultured Paracoccus sp.]|uniref:DUF1217 domain-containing protein n=1 Tax=uncultured Paracoccus sp. TaxID=189685 RepID=UPI002603CCCB|nr:DUF1217 domain-containing protein [uncultured Paracoccus sp.]
MTAAIHLGTGGLAGWKLLQRTATQQKEMLAADPMVARTTRYFRETIGRTAGADDLVSDHRLMTVALGAYGLESQIASKAFIRKVLEEPRGDDRSLANRMVDKRYQKLAAAFGYDQGNQMVSSSGFGDRISALYVEREFERRVGEGDQNLRLALNAQRELRQMTDRTSTEATLWYEVLGNTQLRKVFEQAFGFGQAYGRLPIDRQLAEFTASATSLFGSSSFKVIASEAGIEKLVQRFLLRAQMAESAATSPFSTALTLLRRGG